MAVVEPSVFTDIRHVFIDVEVRGTLTAGVTVADWGRHWGKQAQTHVIMAVDIPRFYDVYVERLRRLYERVEGGSA